MFKLTCPHCKVELPDQNNDEEDITICPYCNETLSIRHEDIATDETKVYSCPNCNAELKFLLEALYSILFGFKCGSCKTKYKIILPARKRIVYRDILVKLVSVALFIVGVDLLGWIVILPGSIALNLIVYFQDRWLRKYVSTHGMVTRMDAIESDPLNNNDFV